MAEAQAKAAERKEAAKGGDMENTRLKLELQAQENQTEVLKAQLKSKELMVESLEKRVEELENESVG